MYFIDYCIFYRERLEKVSRDTEAPPNAIQKIVVVVVLLFYVHGKQPWSCRDGQLTKPHFS